MHAPRRRYLIAFDACDEISTGDSDGAKSAHLPRPSRHGSILTSPFGSIYVIFTYIGKNCLHLAIRIN